MLYMGNKVFYPSFGAGVVINIEEKEVYGSINRYYIIKLLNDIITMVPVTSREAKGIRLCSTKEECIKALDIFKGGWGESKEKWLDRYKVYTKAIKEGNFFNMCSVLNDVLGLRKVRKISKGEEKFLNDILNMVSEEISLVLEIDIERVKISIVKGDNLIVE